MRIFSDDPNFVFYVKDVHTIKNQVELREYAQQATDILKSAGYEKTQRTFQNQAEMIKYVKGLV